MCCCVVYIGGRASGVSDQDFSRVGRGVLLCTVLGAEPSAYPTKNIYVLVVGVRVRYCALYIAGSAFSLSDQNYPRACD